MLVVIVLVFFAALYWVEKDNKKYENKQIRK